MLKPAFYTLSLLGTIAIWGRNVLDGSFARVFAAVNSESTYILPGTKEPLLTSITGIRYPIDYQLGILILYFWEAVDGSHPATSAVGIYFLGQYLSILTVMLTDSFRKGQVSGFGKAIAWTLLFQALAIGSSSGIWAALYTASSPLVYRNLPLSSLQQASLASPSSTLFLTPALAFGFIAPSIIMAIPSPSLVSNRFQQLAVVVWNVFPLLVFALHKTFSFLLPKRGFLKQTSPISHLKAIRLTNAFVLAVSFAVHVAVSSLSLATVFFPALFAPGYADELSPASVFAPPIAIIQSKTTGEGLRSFLLWDQVFGYSIMLIVALMQLETVAKVKRKTFSWVKTIPLVLVGAVVAGPGSVCLVVSWVRDEILFDYGKDSVLAKTK
ncbi:uncharacterized protein BDZ99DRAFT_491664 [Mytilinidion resinicola]|uniref:Uncharacterized protein n=1 Tax=Mytilinidion resinicola TaxID=574789 RepID=A0A6A6Y539_9PEZI|nr:uncharacterized protein BDZ99DRAFT_491664 [Mytilinidion resinicola]KAF2803638.1 hypothetical protein BDZ99DRAFT_491664 [Mytilinidion resinicola]